jgi:hypothetical protein
MWLSIIVYVSIHRCIMWIFYVSAFVEFIAWWWLNDKQKHIVKLYFNPNKRIINTTKVCANYGRFAVSTVKTVYTDSVNTTGC